MNQALIIDAIRIPRARAHTEGAYAHLPALDLIAPLFRALAERNQLDTSEVDDVILGCNTQIGEQGANPAKIAALYAGWSESVSGTTINRFCCSSLDAVNQAAAGILSGMQDLVVAGGVESLSRVPMFSDKGAWFADPKVARSTRFVHMGLAADLLANLRGFSREQLDALALESHDRAAHAREKDYFRSLIPIPNDEGQPVLDSDDAIRPNSGPEKLASLPAIFAEASSEGGNRPILARYPEIGELDHRHTAATSPALVDGASLLLLAGEDAAGRLGLKARARVRHFAVASCEPVQMLTGHILATQKLLAKTGLTSGDIDLFEVNESFAASVLAFVEDLDVPRDKLNVNGSAMALGHPLGATGGNLLGTLLDELERRNLKRGLVAIPGGAGVGVATLIERV